MSTTTSTTASTPSSTGKRQWPLGMFGCLCYKDLKGNQRFFPDFCPFSLICSNMMAGRVYTQVHEEKVNFNGLGWVGMFICIVLIPLAIYSPLGGLVCFGLIANYLRLKVIAKYNVEEHDYFCCGSLNPCLNFVHNACNYPCSLFQMKVAMDQWDEENPQAMENVAAPLAKVVGGPSTFGV